MRIQNAECKMQHAGVNLLNSEFSILHFQEQP